MTRRTPRTTILTLARRAGVEVHTLPATDTGVPRYRFFAPGGSSSVITDRLGRPMTGLGIACGDNAAIAFLTTLVAEVAP